MAAVRVKMCRLTVYIIGIYRTKNSLIDSMDVISTVLETVPTWNAPVILVGDINIDFLKMERDQVMLCETLLGYNITRIPLPPTRITPHSKTSIDCVCTNLEEKEVSVKVLNAGISDHTAQMCTVNFLTRETNSLTLRSRIFSDDNIQNFKSILANQTWDHVYNSSHIDTAYNNFNGILVATLDLTCPYKIGKHNQRRKQIRNLETEKLRKEYLRANERYLLTGSFEDKRISAAKKKDYDLKIKELRRQATADQIACSQNKSKALWAVINKERRTKLSGGLQEISINDKITHNPYEIVEYLNTTFTTMADSLISKNNPFGGNIQPLPLQLDTPTFTLQETTIEEVVSVINSLPSKVSAGVDEISSKMLKACTKELAEPLTFLINKSFQCCTFPSFLKLSKVTPIFKQGNHLEATNYRPISQISTFSKVFEKIVLLRLLDYLTHHNLLTNQQHGFTKNKSTTTALISFIEYVIDQVENKNITTAILLDLSKAFDTLDHELLLKKLINLGVHDPAIGWFRSYLTNRQQVVEIKMTQNNKISHIRSSPKPVLRGVPQGSVLGPVLFTLFTNDLPKYLEEYTTTLMYADDTVLLMAEKSPVNLEIRSYTAMNMAVQYCCNNSLVVNEAKTQQIIMGTKRDQAVHLPNVVAATEAKYLGLTIDEELKWTPHIDKLCMKLSSGLYVVKRIKTISDTATAKTAYFALFEAHLRYGILVWGKSSAGNLQRILVIQKKAVRALASLQPRDSCRPAFVNLSILTVVSLYVLEAVTYAHEFGVSRGCDTHSYNTRRAADFHLPAHHRTLFEEKPSYMGAKLWNYLPQNFKMYNMKTFKREVKKWLLANPFYTVEEYLRRNEN